MGLATSSLLRLCPPACAHSHSGSCTNVSSTDTSVSRWLRSTCSHHVSSCTNLFFCTVFSFHPSASWWLCSTCRRHTSAPHCRPLHNSSCAPRIAFGSTNHCLRSTCGGCRVGARSAQSHIPGLQSSQCSASCDKQCACAFTSASACKVQSAAELKADREWMETGRSTWRVISAVRRNTPSCPDTPKASIMFCVSRKGTTSGRASVRPYASFSIQCQG